MGNLLIKNIGTLATALGSEVKKGAAQGEISMLTDAWILIADDKIVSVGTGTLPAVSDAEIIDAQGKLVTPGLIDAHTHLAFGGWRQNELGMKLRGVPYLDILAQGGGILSSVRSTRASTQDELAAKASRAMDEMLRLGTTTCEAKSGYGLTVEDELKQLRAVRSLDGKHPVELVSTFLGAHALPSEFKENRKEYLRIVCEEMMPAVAKENLAQYCDIFCETGVFTAEESRMVLEAGKKHGLIPKIHADEIDPIGGSQLAGEIGAISAEHLIVCPPDGIESLAKGGVIACLLPATSFYLGATFAPARDMIQAGVPVAMASDFNPGSCPCLNMQFVINLGCLKYRMTAEEVLTAVTLNAAAAIGLEKTHGTIEAGKFADILIWDAPDLDYICYRMGSNLVNHVFKKGVKVV